MSKIISFFILLALLTSCIDVTSKKNTQARYSFPSSNQSSNNSSNYSLCSNLENQIQQLSYEKSQIKAEDKFSFKYMMVFPAIYQIVKMNKEISRIDKEIEKLEAIQHSSYCNQNVSNQNLRDNRSDNHPTYQNLYPNQNNYQNQNSRNNQNFYPNQSNQPQISNQNSYYPAPSYQNYPANNQDSSFNNFPNSAPNYGNFAVPTNSMNNTNDEFDDLSQDQLIFSKPRNR